jgi:hypothetical protein
VLCSLLDVSHGDFGYLESRGQLSALVSILQNRRVGLQSLPVVRLALGGRGLVIRPYSCEVAIRLDPVSYDTLDMMVSMAQRLKAPGRSYFVLSGALSGSHGRIVAEIPLDVGHDDMTVDAISGHKPLPSNVAGHSAGRHSEGR